MNDIDKKPKNKKSTAKKARDNVKHSALKPGYNLKSRSDLLDFDYLDKLNKKELDWLNKFVKESVNASFEKNVKGEFDDKKNLHKGAKMRKKCTDSNNARNRCILTRAKASGTLTALDTIIHEEQTKEDLKDELENGIIEKVDEEGAIELVNSTENFEDADYNTNNNSDESN